MDAARLGEMCDKLEAEDQAEAVRRRKWLTEQFGPRFQDANNFTAKMWQMQDDWEKAMCIPQAEPPLTSPEDLK